MAPFSTFRNGMFSGEIDEDDYSDNKDKDTDMSEKFGTAKVILDSSKNVYSVDSTYLELSDEQIEDAANKVIAANTSEGKLKKYKLYYKASFGSSYSVIAFADYSAASEEISATIIFTILLFSGTMLIFLLISIWLSGYAMRPVAKAWAQQQQFVADASHELKTPLTAILATNNILLSNPDLTIREQEKWIENSQAEANHMKDLIANMLFLAKSEDEQVQLVLSEISLSDIVTDTTLQFEPVAFENGTLIDSSIEEAITIQGDLTQMRQLVHILIDNACKYAGESGYVKVCLRREGGTIKLEVCNSGKPIPAEDLPHIFERFYRSDKARTQQNQSGGYGLGLAIAKSIADRHKAQISAASSEEGGTTFTVIFKNK
jgi:signal transduction histidine kinase